MTPRERATLRKYPRDPLPCPECGRVPQYAIIGSSPTGDPGSDCEITYARRYQCKRSIVLAVWRWWFWPRPLSVPCGPVATTHWMCDGWPDMALDTAAEYWNIACEARAMTTALLRRGT